MKNYHFFIVTSHVTKQIVPAFVHLFNKYVSPEESVTFLSNCPIEDNLPENFQVFQRCEIEEPIQNWSYTLYQALKDVPYNYIILGLDDFLPIEKFNYEIFADILQYLESHPQIVRCSLGPDVVCDYVTSFLERRENYNLIEQGSQENYQCSTQFSVWKKEYLLEKLKNPRTPWDFEVLGSEEAKKENYKGLAGFEKMKVVLIG